MKTRLWMIVPVLVGAFLLGGCSDDPRTVTAAGEQDSLVERLVEMGVRRDQIVDRGDHFVVEGDIRINKNDLRFTRAVVAPDGKVPPDAPSLQRYASTTSHRLIRVDLSAVEFANPVWAAAMRDAMNNWSGISDSYISFVGSGGGSADITLTLNSNLGNCTVALASYPVAGAVGSTIQVNPAYTNWYAYSQLVWIMTHELGHTIGFAHTDQSTFGTLVPGTPDGFDPASVMNSGATYGGCPPAAPQWSWFSTSDQVAMRFLYPIPPLTGLVATQSAGRVVLSWNAVPGTSYYRIRRVERLTSGIFGSVSEYPDPWFITPATSFDTGAAWTGSSTCYRPYMPTEYSEYWYEVQAVLSTGYSNTASVPSQDSPC